MMSLHKLTAGDGYTYLTRQVATVDSTERGYSSLGDYYAAKGESPGVWIGAQAQQMGLAGSTVTEQQMKNLFGQGLHPDAQRLEAEALAGLPEQGSTRDKQRAVDRAGKLGSKFPVFEASPEWHEKLAAAYRTYNLDHGLTKGDRVPDDAKQAIRTRVASTMFTTEYGRAPQHDHELAGFVAQQSRPASSAVAGYDLTFSPVKSVSTMWAIATPDVAAKIESAHQAAVTGTLKWLEKEAGYTREGTGSISQIRIKGFLATAFTHRDSRAGDPDLHTHVAVSNKVQTPDGRWLALDARMLYRYNVPASEQYNLLLEKEVMQRVGGRFADRGDATAGKREIRELVGVPASLNEYFSSRAVMIDGRRTELIAQFRADHGRVPTAIERIQLSQQANLATRQAKHEPTSLGEQRALWQSYPEQVCPDSPAEILADVLGQEPHYADLTPELVSELTGRVVQTVTQSRAQWRENNLSAEACRQVKAAGVDPGQMEELAEIVTTAAAGLDHSIPIGMDTEIDRPIPASLLDVDGKAVFRMAKGQLYTSPAILAAESRIVAAAGQRDGWALTDADVEIAELEWSANNEGRTLNTGQAAMVRQVATSGRRVQLVFGPAGTGKTTAIAVLVRAVEATGREVVVLAPTAAAARVAGEAIPGVRTETLHKLAWHLRPNGAGDSGVTDPGVGATEEADNEAWISDIGPDHLVIIDEAGLAGTKELDVAITHITSVGGRVLLVGDDRQRAANGAGGVLRDIESAHGALTLDEVMRFQDRGDAGAGALHGRATLALRQGNPGSAGYYVDRDLLRAVTPDTAAGQVFTGWAADIAAGADSIMIAPTLDMVSELNGLARAARIAAAGAPVGAERYLPRGEKVSAGDLIVTKKNKRVLSLGGTDFVRNNYRWTVEKVHEDGSITATEVTRGITRTLPAWYVDKGWVRLGYAHTDASVQGMTVGGRDRVGTAHVVFTDTTNRNQLYTSLTRATDRTISYGIVPGTGDPHEVTTPGAVTPETVIEMFSAVIGRDGSDRSATTTVREAGDPMLRLGAPGNAAAAYSHAVVTGCIDLLDDHGMRRLVEGAEVLVPGVTDAPAWETLRGHLATIAANGGDPLMDLTRVTGPGSRELDTAADVAAVIDYRLDPTGNHSLGAGPLPYLPAMPAALLEQPCWDAYLPARSALVAELAQQVRDQVFGWTVDDAPAWAIPYLPDMNLVADLAVWRAANGVPDTDLRPAGPRPLRLTQRTWHQSFVDRAVAVAGDPSHGAHRWTRLLADEYHLDVAQDDWFPVLAARLTLADTTGLNVPGLLDQVITGQDALPAQIPAKALWWRLEPHLGSLTAQGQPGTGHRLRPAWTADLEQAVGELDAERIMSDRLWPTLVAHIDRTFRDGYTPGQVLPAAADMFTAIRPTLHAHEMATVLLWQINMVTDPNPPDPDFESPYLDPQDQDLAAPAGAYQLLDADYHRQAQTTTLTAPPAEPGVSGLDPFDPDRYAAAAALVDAAYAELEHTEPEEEPPAPDDDVFGDAPPDLYDDAPTPPRTWTTPPADPPARVPDPVEPDVAPEPALPDPARQALHDRLYAANAAAWQYYRAQATGSWVPGYISGRGLDPEAFGYAPNTYTSLADHLRHNGFTDTELVAAGLGTHSRRGEVIDRFRDRAILPITTPDGHVASFIGRINPDHTDKNPAHYTAPKYVNGPTTDIFTKGDLPYGLNPTTVTALQAGADLVLVEGPMDAEAVNTAARTAGDPIVAIAPNSTALTAAHLQALNQIAPLANRQIIEAFDSDPAGRAAAGKAHALLAQLHIHHADSVTGLTGKDPAQMLADTGPAGLHTAVQQRRPLTDVALDQIIERYDIADGTVESRYHAMRAVLPAIAELPRDQVYEQTVRVAEVVGWDTDRAITWVTDYLTEHPQPSQAPPDPGTSTPSTDLGLPTPPTLTTPRPEPRADLTSPTQRGTLLLHPATDDQPIDLGGLEPTWEPAVAQVDHQPVDLDDPDSDWEPAVTQVLPETDDTAPADMARALAEPDVDTELRDPETATITGQELFEERAAAAWLEAADPDLHAHYVQVQATGTAADRAAAAADLLAQYRNHAAVEADTAEVADTDAPVDLSGHRAADTDVTATNVEVSERNSGDQDEAELGKTGQFPDLPDEVLEEEIGQLTARYAESAQVADRAAELVEQIRTQIAQGRGSEVTQQRNQDQDNQRRFAAMQHALEVSEAAEAARVRSAALGDQLMEAEQNLRDVTGAFTGRRRAEMTQRLDQARAAHEQQREQMLNLGRRSHALTAELGTVHQQRQALALRDPDAYRAQLTQRLERAQQEDLQELQDAAEWASSTAARHATLASELAQMTAEQTRRAEHPDPTAEQTRRERYEQLQTEEAELTGRQQGLTWGEDDPDIPGTSDNSIER